MATSPKFRRVVDYEDIEALLECMFTILCVNQRPKRAGIRGEESGQRLIMAGRGEAGASYDGASWGEAGRGEVTTGRSGAGRDNDLTKRGEAGLGEIMT